jgi:hypothetical protein
MVPGREALLDFYEQKSDESYATAPDIAAADAHQGRYVDPVAESFAKQ